MTELTEKKRTEIQKQAKNILDSFASSLNKAKIKKSNKKSKELSGFREEGNGKKGNEEFRKLFLSNASSKDENSIIAESKKW